MHLIGIDGCRGGWLVARTEEIEDTLAFEVVRDLRGVFADATRGLATVAIDIPIGLADDAARACDGAARARLGWPRACSVFSAPCRPTLDASCYRDACDINLLARGKAISRQLWGIIDKIREVDELISASLQKHVREAHPEVTFAVLAGAGRGHVHGKKRRDGQEERVLLLAEHGLAFDPAAVRARLGRGAVAEDDIVDAAACLVTAARISRGEARVFPDGEARRDGRGLRMEIVA